MQGAKPRRDKQRAQGRMFSMLKTSVIATALFLLAAPALAEDTIRIAYLDPLSGGGASVGEVGLKHFKYMADQINAAGGLNSKKVEIVVLDYKINPEVWLV